MCVGTSLFVSYKELWLVYILQAVNIGYHSSESGWAVGEEESRTVIQVQAMAKITKNRNTRTKMWSILAQIQTERLRKRVWCSNCINTQLLAHYAFVNACSYHKSQSTEFKMCQHKSQVTIFFYERTRTNKTCVLAQITINKVQYILAQIITNNFFL